MPATLPTVGGDEGTWGTELNTWCLVNHAADGTHDDLDGMICIVGNMLCYEGAVLVYENEPLIYI